MKKVGIVYDPVYLEHRTTLFYPHPEKRERLISTLKALEEHNLYGKDHDEHFVLVDPRYATEEELKWAHSESLIARVKQTVERSGKGGFDASMDPDTPVSPMSFNAALAAAGGNFSAIDGIFNNDFNRAFVLCRPPGHHANQNASKGFCLFNNIALAALYLFKSKNLSKVAIVDFDVHAGNGTEHIFNNGVPNMPDKELLMISTHRDPHFFYPGECFMEDIGEGAQEGKIMNITFPAGAGDKSMKLALSELIEPALEEFKPEFILFSAGFDAHYRDPLGGLNFTEQLYAHIIERVGAIADKYAQGRMSATLEGGYDLKGLANSITNVVHKMADGTTLEEGDADERDRIIEEVENKIIPKVKEIHSPYWKFLK
ncbi:MAG: histone deacetylase family protein [Promethearchaeota archaeon]